MSKAENSFLSHVWGKGYLPGEYTAPPFLNFGRQADLLAKQGVESDFTVALKHTATGGLAAYAEKYELAGNYSPFDANLAGFVARLFKGDNVVSTGINLSAPSGSTSPSVTGSLFASQSLRVAGLRKPIRLTARFTDLPTANYTVRVGADFSHGAFAHSHHVQRQGKTTGEWSVVHTATAGGDGFAVGAQVDTSTSGELLDYNVGLQLERKNALQLALSTEDRLKTLALSEFYRYGNVDLGGKVKFDTLNVTGGVTSYALAAAWRLPKDWAASTVRARVTSDNTFAVRVISDDIPAARLSLGVEAPFSLAATGLKFGLGVTVGDRRKDEHCDEGSALITSAPKCPHCH